MEVFLQSWELRYLHELAVIKAAYIMHGRTLPEQEYGKLKYDKNIFRSFYGKKFHEALNGLGHDHAEFDACKCSRRL